MPRSSIVRFYWFASLVSIGFVSPSLAQTTATLRIATYNIEDDINGATTPLPGLYQVIEAMGAEKAPTTGNIQPVDILGLEETTSNSVTVAPIVNALNAYYDGYYGVASGSPAAQQPYAQSSVQGTQSGSNASGNGPNAIVYNQKTLTLIASVGVGTPHGSSNGEYRQIMRYQFRPVGGTSANDFYVYVTHMKSTGGDTAAADVYADEKSRAQEAAIIRSNAATLPANSSVLYMGDFNLSNTNGFTNPSPPNDTVSAYQTMVSSSPSVIGQAVDALNPTNATETWDSNSTYKALLTDSSTRLRYRDDLELMTANVYNGSGSLKYIQGTMHPFGNNGSISVNGNPGSSSSTALNNVLQLGDLNFDHKVTVADMQATMNATFEFGWIRNNVTRFRTPDCSTSRTLIATESSITRISRH